MSTLGFEDYVEPLKLYLHKYRETEVRTSGLPPFHQNYYFPDIVSPAVLGKSGELPQRQMRKVANM